MASSVGQRREDPLGTLVHKADALRLRDWGVEQQPTPWISWLIAILLALDLVGYAIAGSASHIFGLDSTATSYPLRGLVMVLSVTALAITLFKGEFRAPFVIVAFLFLYLLRLLWDNSLGNIPESGRALSIFLAAVMLPALALTSGRIHFDERRTTIAIAILGSFSCLLVLIALSTTSAGNVADSAGRLSFETLNPITIGYTGLFTAGSGYFLGSYLKIRARLFVCFPVTLLGITVFVLGGSRGPVVGALLFLVLLSLVNRRNIIAMFALGLAALVLFVLQGDDLAIFHRFTNLESDPSVLDRLFFQRIAIELAVENPLFGHAYVETIYYTYPHNLLIESALALGISGFALMLAMQFKLFLNALTLLRARQYLLPFVASCAFTTAWISGAIWASADFFIAGVASWLIANRIQESRAAAVKNKQALILQNSKLRRMAQSI